MVGVAELPAEKTFVLTGWRGIIRLDVGQDFLLGSERDFRRLLLLNGSLFWTNSAGTRIASGRGVTGSVIFGAGKFLTGAGACGTGGGVLTRPTKW